MLVFIRNICETKKYNKEHWQILLSLKSYEERAVSISSPKHYFLTVVSVRNIFFHLAGRQLRTTIQTYRRVKQLEYHSEAGRIEKYITCKSTLHPCH